MSPEHWKAVKEAFEHCVNLAEAGRAEYLASLSAIHPEVSAEVARLLNVDREAEAFFERSPVVDVEPDLGPGAKVGPYVIHRLIGEGGMARVFLAIRQGDGRGQPVALKVMSPSLNHEEIVRRFERERHILQRLRHPFIVAFLDAGATETGIPFVVMEYVEGLAIDDYCDRLELDLVSRVRLFASVCGGVHYAHECGVIHRDLKPGNILVGTDGAPKLLDFGIAKLLPTSTATEDLTRTGRRLFTPAYASPEQLSGAAVTKATDIYALGMVLYRLLVGSLPYRAHELDLDEVRDVRSPAPVELPSRAASRVLGRQRIARQLAGDLDLIILSAIDRSPSRRYASAAQLEDDLRRFLANEPISLRPSTLYRWSRALGRVSRSKVRRIRRLWARITDDRRELTGRLESADRLRTQAMASGVQSSHSREIAALQIALRMAEELGTNPEVRLEALRLVSITANNLTAALCAAGEHRRAVDMASRALSANELLQKHAPGDERAVANLRGNWANLGALHAMTGADLSLSTSQRIEAWQEARSCFERALDTAVSTGVKFNVPTDAMLARRISACNLALNRLRDTHVMPWATRCEHPADESLD